MGLEFLGRITRTSIISGLVLAAVIAVYASPPAAAAWLLGCAWTLVNIHFIRLLVGAVCVDRKRQKLRITLLVLVKVPALYAAGFLFIRSGYFPVAGMLAGFMWPLSVIVLKAVGRMVLRLDDEKPGSMTPKDDLVSKGR